MRLRRRRWGPDEHPFDVGLQPERVALSWQRTALAIAVGSLLYGRIVASQLGILSLLPVMAGLVLAAVMGWWSRRRYEHHHVTLTRGGGPIADGALLAVVATCVGLAGLLALWLMTGQAVVAGS